MITTYNPLEPSWRTAAEAITSHNTAVLALLDAIGASLHPAEGSDWAHAGDAQWAVMGLLDVYSALAGRKPRMIEIPIDGDNEQRLRIIVPES